MKYYLSIILCFIIAVNINCKKAADNPEGRSFYMGVTPWPADFTAAEVDTAYRFINEYCDIVSHHFDDGIPYEEAYYNRPMPQALVQDIATRKAKTGSAKKIFLSIAALAFNRVSKPGYYTNAPATDSIKNYWSQLPFDDSKMITAYVNYVSWLIEQLPPVYVNFGVESNAVGWNPADFQHYKNFIAQVYTRLKNKYSTLPFFISFIVDETTAGFNYAGQLTSYTDFIGLSAYPYVTVSSSAAGNTDPRLFPANYFEKFANLAADKPLAFAETGYIAENLVIPSFSLNKQGNAAWQRDYLEKVLKFCNERKAKLFIWFCSKDYDAADDRLRSLNLYQDLFGLWEDTGLKDEAGRARPAYFTWQHWIGKNKTD